MKELVCTKRTQGAESLKESKAVEPNSTATTPTSPARGTMVLRLASGEMTSSRSSRTVQGDSLPMSVE